MSPTFHREACRAGAAAIRVGMELAAVAALILQSHLPNCYPAVPQGGAETHTAREGLLHSRGPGWDIGSYGASVQTGPDPPP